MIIIVAPEEAFWLRNLNNCLKLESSSDNFIIGTSCPTSPTLDMLWIWITAGNKQLIINVKTLTCMESQRNNEKVKMKQCEKTSRLQKLRCTEHHNEEIIEMKIKWGTSRFFHLNSKGKYVKSINRVQLYGTMRAPLAKQAQHTKVNSISLANKCAIRKTTNI